MNNGPNACKPGCQAAQRACLCGMRMHDVKAAAKQDYIKARKRYTVMEELNIPAQLRNLNVFALKPFKERNGFL